MAVTDNTTSEDMWYWVSVYCSITAVELQGHQSNVTGPLLITLGLVQLCIFIIFPCIVHAVIIKWYLTVFTT